MVLLSNRIFAASVGYLLLVDLLHAEQSDTTPTPPPVAAAQQKAPLPLPSGATPPLTIEQIRNNLPASSAERFEFLRRQRKVTLEAVDETASLSKTLTASITLAQNRKDSLEAQARDSVDPLESTEETQSVLRQRTERYNQAKQKLDAAKAKPGTRSEELAPLETELSKASSSLNFVKDFIRKSEQRSKEEEKRKADVQAATEQLARLVDQQSKVAQAQLSYQRLLGELDDMVNQLFISSDATNSFKLRMSIAFSVLVGLVIAGFFLIAWSNEDVKKSIFSNEAGIQFITMFAIVIAVILFGIIGVLEGKELSALLGGLSGYILGKGK